jgi:ABC-type transporter MlaC component
MILISGKINKQNLTKIFRQLLKKYKNQDMERIVPEPKDPKLKHE